MFFFFLHPSWETPASGEIEMPRDPAVHHRDAPCEIVRMALEHLRRDENVQITHDAFAVAMCTLQSFERIRSCVRCLGMRRWAATPRRAEMRAG